ncbi:MAG: T9SS type A sorting domain-containing protein [candidate division WOR-3 bacterium]
MHVNSSYASYGMYLLKARNRFFYLPMPGTTYYTPWLWIDGDYSAGSSYSNWENLILQRAAVESRINARIWGDYNQATRTGTIYVRFISDTVTTLQHNVLFVITEDSIYRQTPNGDQWHNHVARDYLPDHIGTPVTLNYQDSITVSYPFSIASGWVESRVEIIAMIQDPMNVNITKRINQGAKIKLLDLNLTGVEEPNQSKINNYPISVSPNPAHNQVWFTFALNQGSKYKITIFDISGRNVKTISGVTRSNNESVKCDFSNSVSAGAYFYRFECDAGSKIGKIILK